MPPSCALLDRFAIGARVALLWQHNANRSYKPASIPRYDDIVRTLGGVCARCWLVTGGWRGRSQHYCSGLDCRLPLVAFWQHNANAKCQRVHACTHSMPIYFCERLCSWRQSLLIWNVCKCCSVTLRPLTCVWTIKFHSWHDVLVSITST